jgi:hypothetical protein
MLDFFALRPAGGTRPPAVPFPSNQNGFSSIDLVSARGLGRFDPALRVSLASERDHDLESRAVRHRRLVDDVASVRSSVRLGDREPESGAVASATRLRAACEPVEEARDELTRNAFAPILDSKTKVPVLPVGGDRDRWLAVAQ